MPCAATTPYSANSFAARCLAACAGQQHDSGAPERAPFRPDIVRRATANAGISGSDIRDMMLEAVEARFGGVRAPHPVEWLSDNGSIHTARETRVFATQLNLVPCFTPVASPESNGMSEALVKTIKRDYLRISSGPDATTALDQIAGWFDDYNESHPYSGLRMHSPREFRRAPQPAEVSD